MRSCLTTRRRIQMHLKSCKQASALPALWTPASAGRRGDQPIGDAFPKFHDSLPHFAGPSGPQPPYSHQEFFPSYDATDDLVRVQAARQKLAQDTAELQERLAMRREESSRMKEDLRTLGLV